MTTVIKAHKIRKLEKAIAGLIKYDSFLCPIRTNDPNFISHICFAMLSIISRIARGFGLLAVHLTIVRQHEGAMRIFESSFPRDTIVDVDVHLSIPYENRSPSEFQAYMDVV